MIMKYKKFLISAPFGNYFSHEKATSICGTFTWNKRGTVLKRILRSLQTIRPVAGGYVNRMGLLNPGIRSVTFEEEKIYSITAIENSEWNKLIDYIPEGTNLEINLSCPNVAHTVISGEEVERILEKFGEGTIFKLAPTKNVYMMYEFLRGKGVKTFHFSNTIPTERGGESGSRVKAKSLDIIQKIRIEHKDTEITIIGGGGIYYKEDLELYDVVGADHYSLASVWFKPWKARKILRNG